MIVHINDPIVKELTPSKKIKCLVWDLDNTLWEGVLLEDKEVVLREGVVAIIRTLDERGILQSIASRNEHDLAMEKLKEFGLDEYFLYPQINWNNKSSSVQQIARSINIGMDTMAFIDDQPFELEEVAFHHPQVLCINASRLGQLTEMPQLKPTFQTEDSQNRRKMYMSDIVRNQVEEAFDGSQEDFLSSLQMKLTISQVKENDLQRAEELTVRTHQLNATGYTYSYEELDHFRSSDKHKLLIAGLEDKYGTYGKIGLTLLECEEEIWTLKLLLMSCRVISRGVGTLMLGHVMRLAKEAHVRLRAEFVSTDRNRMMYIAYSFAGFKEVETKDGLTIFENDLSLIQPIPEYIDVIVE
ncbi:HAD-IIIC family phosphatase [Gorillibacterium sp. sgz500922]|uniref:HAD-IIIC family phosphatase n=1 Tax=Gorillibacterium sp. sgz500922 TaxID=3446694 RepID=UPI003F67F350